jgi:hypothetical protein
VVSHYRTGNRNARNLYLVGDDGTEVHVGCMFDPLDGPRTVAALNAQLTTAEVEARVLAWVSAAMSEHPCCYNPATAPELVANLLSPTTPTDQKEG